MPGFKPGIKGRYWGRGKPRNGPADKGHMPRISITVSPRASLVAQLRRLHGRVQRREREALDRAHEAGRLLLDVPAAERAALLADAGVSRRSGQDYARIAEHWDLVSAQRCASIRAALAALRKAPRPRRGPFLWPDWPEIFLWFERNRQARYEQMHVRFSRG